jgi:hypothetical protein
MGGGFLEVEKAGTWQMQGRYWVWKINKTAKLSMVTYQ